MHQNLTLAVGYNSLALPVAAGVFAPFGFTLSPAVGALAMSGSNIIVAVNAVALKRLRLRQIERKEALPCHCPLRQKPGYPPQSLRRIR